MLNVTEAMLYVTEAMLNVTEAMLNVTEAMTSSMPFLEMLSHLKIENQELYTHLLWMF